MSSIDLYAVLGVDRDASTDEIRAAWKGAVADLDPTDPKLNVFNQAGAVLLDPARRERYDAELGADEPSGGQSATGSAASEGRPGSGSAAEGGPAGSPSPLRGSNRPASRGSAAAAVPAKDLNAARARSAADAASLPTTVSGTQSPRSVSTRLLAALAVLTVAAVLAAIFAAGPIGRALPDRGVPDDQRRLSAAASAAEKAAVPVLSYDYRHLAEDKKAATARMTDDFREDYEKTFALIEQNAPETQAVVAVEVLASAIAGATEEQVDVLLFVNRPTTKKGSAEPDIFRDQVTFSMRLDDGEWLVDDMRTTRPA